MRGDLILGQIDRDVACAVALGVLEAPRVVANFQSITVHDAQMRPVGTISNWLDGDDPLDVATRECLKARQEGIQAGAPKFGQPPWKTAKLRDEAVKRSLAAKRTAVALLTERGVLEYARQNGLRINE